MKILLKLLFILLVATAPLFNANGQNVVIKTDQKDFIKQIHSILYDKKGDLQLARIKNFMPYLEKKWSEERFTSEEKDKIISITDKMVKNKMLNAAAFVEYFAALSDIAMSSLSHNSIECWLEYADKHYKDKNQKAFAEWLVTIQKLIEENRLYKSGSMQWLMNNATYSFEDVDGFSVKVESCDLVCLSRTDSLVIRETNGYFDGVSKWTGSGGRVDWKKFNDENLNDVFVEFDKYTINLKNFEYVVDSARLTNPKLPTTSILGRFHDKVFTIPPSKKSQFPTFVSYNDSYQLTDVFKNVDLFGSVGMRGVNMMVSGRNERPSVVTFRNEDKAVMFLRSQMFSFNDEGFASDAVNVTIPFENDSIYHVNLQMRYGENKRELMLFMPTNGNGRFGDSYHNIDISIDAMYWNIDDKQASFYKLSPLGTDSHGFIKSEKYFEKDDFLDIQGMDKENPLTVVYNYLEQYNEKEVRIRDLCDFVRKPEQQVVSMILRLEQLGYLNYDNVNKTAYPKESLYNAVKASRGLVDYDIIKIESFTRRRQTNFILNFDNFDFDVFGVKKVNVSKAKNVTIYPDSLKITFKKNLDFDFGGRLTAGLFEFYSNKGNFLYDDFLVDFKHVDSVSFFVRKRDIEPNGGFVRVKNVLADIECTIMLDDKNNKSGEKDTPNYPILKSKQQSYIYFDKPSINDGLLDRKKFNYVVDPFEIDSLLTFSTTGMAFQGVLHSAGLFPDIRHPLLIEDDYSLGLDWDFGEDGTTAFDNKARYFNRISLSNRGFFGDGRIEYNNTKFSSPHFVFYLDSVVCIADQLMVNAVQGRYSRPSLSVDSASVSWHFTHDSLFVKTLQKPADIYNDYDFHGLLSLTPDGLTGAGFMNVDKSKIKSKDFKFALNSFVADTSDFLFTFDGREAVVASGFNISVDVDNNKSVFRHIDSMPNTLEFPLNSVKSVVNYAEWTMKDNNFSFETESFFSTNPLNLFTVNCGKADYNVATNIITASAVKNVVKGKFVIGPKDGIVCMMENAVIDTLRGATVFLDSIDLNNSLTDINIVINDEGLRGEGYCQYTDPFLMKHDIFLSDIRSEGDSVMSGKGTISQEESLALDDNFAFYGNVFFRSDRNIIRFNGFAKMTTEKYHGFGWFPFETEIMPENIVLPLGDTVSHFVSSGIVRTSRGLAVDFLKEGGTPEPEDVFASYDGSVRFDRPSSSYIIENPDKQKNSKMVFNTKTDKVSGDVATDFGLGARFMKFDADGTFDYSYEYDSLLFDVNLLLDFPIENKLIDMMFDTIYKTIHPDAVVGDNIYFDDESEAEFWLTDDEVGDGEEVPDSDNEVGEDKQTKSGKSGKKGKHSKDEVQFEKAETSAVLNMEDVDIRYVRKSNMLVAVDSVHLVGIGSRKLDESVKLLMMANLNEPQSLKLYIEATPDIWFYFDYEEDRMLLVSNDENFNEALDAVKENHRVFNDKKAGGHFEYGLGDYYNVSEFWDLLNVIIK